MYRGVVKGWFGHIQDAVTDFEQAQTISERVGDLFRRYLVHGWRGEAYALCGDYAAAGKELGQCIVLGDQIGTSFHRGASLAFGAACGCMRATLPARSARLKKPRTSPPKRANPGASRLPCACSLKSGCLHCRSSLKLLKPPCARRSISRSLASAAAILRGRA